MFKKVESFIKYFTSIPRSIKETWEAIPKPTGDPLQDGTEKINFAERDRKTPIRVFNYRLLSTIAYLNGIITVAVCLQFGLYINMIVKMDLLLMKIYPQLLKYIEGPWPWISFLLAYRLFIQPSIVSYNVPRYVRWHWTHATLMQVVFNVVLQFYQLIPESFYINRPFMILNGILVTGIWYLYGLSMYHIWIRGTYPDTSYLSENTDIWVQRFY
jgi:hypothetical protein